MRLARTVGLILLVMVASVPLGGCGEGADDPQADLVPLVEPPVIAAEGVLTVGLDTEYPPFAGEDKDQIVGLDVDVAAAIAEALGLQLQIVDVKSDAYATALADGEVDVAMGAITIADSVLAEVSFAGSYSLDGPAFFSATESSESVKALAGKRIGAQEGSVAYWTLEAFYGQGVAIAYPTLREAVAACSEGELDLVAGDAIVTAYIARDFPAVRLVGMVDDAEPLGVAVAKDATELEQAVRDALDQLAADGVLDAIHAKWIGVTTPTEPAIAQQAPSEEATGTE